MAPVQKQVRHDLDRLTKRVGRVARALHECQKLNDSFFLLRALQVEPIGKSPAGRRKISEAEFTPLIEFSLYVKLRLIDLNAQV